MEGVIVQRRGRSLPHITRRQTAVLAGLLVAAVIGYGAIQRMRPSQATTASVQTTTVQRGSLQATVNTAGNVTPVQSLSLNFQTSGTVKTVDVKVGDQVEAGQVLAALGTTELELAVANARSAVAAAQANLEQARAAPTAEELAAAQAVVSSAEANLANVKAGATAAETAAAQAQVKAAQAAYDTLLAQPYAATVEAARLNLDQAKNSLWAAQSARDAIKGRGSSSPEEKSQAEAGVLNAEIAVQLAQQEYEDAQQPATTAEIQTALATLKTAQGNLANLKPATADIAAAQSQLTQAQSSLAALTEGPTEEELTIAQASVDQAEIALQQAEAALDQAKLVAPFAGTVTSVSIIAGQTASTSSAAVDLADTANLEIEGQVAEVDIARVQVGQAVEVTLDALPGVTLEGQVTEVAPAGTVSSGVVNYPVTISLVDPDAAVKPGMTANVNIVVDERQNVLLVPNRAIKMVSKQKYVTVVSDGERVQTAVQTGLSSDSYTEVTGGVNEGDEVVINTTTTTTSAAGGGMPGGVLGPL